MGRGMVEGGFSGEGGLILVKVGQGMRRWAS